QRVASEGQHGEDDEKRDAQARAHCCMLSTARHVLPERGPPGPLKIMMRTWRSALRLIAQPIELHRVVARDLAAALGADGRKLAFEELLRVGPDAVGMRVVGAPHDVVLAQEGEPADGYWVGLVVAI